MENPRHRKVIIATDADVDGTHIRPAADLVLPAFFPDVIRSAATLYILQTPCSPQRNKAGDHYRYSRRERLKA